MLVGYVSLTGNVMDFLISRRVETVFLTATGRFRARLGIDEHRHVQLRQAQYIKLSEPAYAVGGCGPIGSSQTGKHGESADRPCARLR